MNSPPLAANNRARVVLDDYYRHFFSGAQCRVYFDGVYIAEIPYVEYSIQSNKAPVYAFNDPYFRLVARGNYLVQGTFHVNLTDRDYLYDKMLEIRSLARKQSVTEVDVNLLRSKNDVEKIGYVNTLEGMNKAALITKFMTTYWGYGTAKGSTYYKRPDEWDLMKDGYIDPDGFDIVMSFGVPVGGRNTFCVKQINNVHISGEATAVEYSGQPIMLQYPFFAKKVDAERTVFYGSEQTVETSDLKDYKDLSNYSITVTLLTHEFLPDGTWHTGFLLDTGNEAIHISSFSGESLKHRVYESDTLHSYPSMKGSGEYGGRKMASYIVGIDRSVEWVEVVNPVATVCHANRIDKVYTTSSFDCSMFSSDNRMVVQRPILGLPTPTL